MASKRGGGSRDLKYNDKEGTVMMYLRGRPLLLYVPSSEKDYNPHGDSELPEEQLKMEWVYGYRGKGARANLHMLPTGELVYFMAGVVVLYNVKRNKQRHYIEHSDDIKCLTVHPSQELIASGQVAGRDPKAKPQVRIWEYRTLNTVAVIGIGDFYRAVSCISFSNGKTSLLAVVDESNNHTISLWDWQKGKNGTKVAETNCSNEEVLGVVFHPRGKRLVTYGKRNLGFFTFDGKILSKKSAVLGSRPKPKCYTIAMYTKAGNILVGDDKGNIMLWEDGNMNMKVARDSAHDGAVFAFTQLEDGTILSGGGKTPSIIGWDDSLNRNGQELQVTNILGSVRTICEAKDGELFVGTTRNCILRGHLDTELSVLMNGHVDDVVALATHPSDNRFLSGGYDKFIRLWDSELFQLGWEMQLSEGVSSVAFSPDGSRIVVGSLTGKCFLINAVRQKILQEFRDADETIEAVSYSPDGSHVAIGSRDNMAYVYEVEEGGKKLTKIGKCRGHSSFILHLDWSLDGEFIRTTSGDYELLYWNAKTCKQITATSDMKDEEWATQWCTLGFSVLGIWPEGADGTDINCVASCNSKLCLASGDDFGNVKLFTYPVTTQRALHKTYAGHSSHVTRVSFFHDDTKLISTGGNDAAVIQWRVD